jgi:MATE family multidrug resistance protein
MLLSNLTVPLLGAVDTAVIGHLPEPHYLGAVAIGALIFNFMYWGCNFLRMGTTGLTAQGFGAADADEIRATLGRALLVAGAIAVFFMALQWPVAWLAFASIEPSPAVELSGRSYFFVRIWGAPAALGNIVLIGWFIGMQNTRVPLALLLCVNGVNIALDLIFVVWLGLGVRGVAGASVIADYVGLGLGLYLASRMLARLGGVWRGRLIFAAGRTRRFLSVNLDIFVRTMCIIFALAYFTAQSARLGDVTLAANAVLMNFIVFLHYGLDGFAFAAEALTGRALGERNRADLKRAVALSLFWSVLAALVASAIYGGLGGPIIRLLTDIAEVRQTADNHLPWLIAAPLVAVWAVLLDGVFVGTTRTREMRNTVMLALAFYVPAAWLIPDALGNHGLWLAIILFLALRGLGLGAIYLRIERRGGFAKVSG